MGKARAPLLVAVALGVAAAMTSYFAIARKQREVQSGWTLAPVVVAAREIAEGTVITEELIARREVPEQFVTRSVVKPEAAGYLLGQRVLAPLQAGDPLLWSQFESTPTAERLAAIVPKNGRAFAIDVTASRTSVGGWVRPNDHVDVIGNFRDAASGEPIAVTLMQNVVVLATGRVTAAANATVITESDRQFQTISLLVLPEEAEMLSLAAETGSLTLTLRNPDDMEVEGDRRRTTLATLMTGERFRALETLRHRTIQVIRGVESREAPGGAVAAH